MPAAVFARFLVQDTSMQPALRPGDRLLVLRWLPARTGDIVVCGDPEQSSQFIAKRVAGRAANGDLLLIGDNANVSRDSRTFGPVPRRLLVGRVVWRYLPSERRGRV
jgi:nickel-type superoxide dismutase maturation protease